MGWQKWMMAVILTLMVTMPVRVRSQRRVVGDIREQSISQLADFDAREEKVPVAGVGRQRARPRHKDPMRVVAHQVVPLRVQMARFDQGDGVVVCAIFPYLQVSEPLATN